VNSKLMPLSEQERWLNVVPQHRVYVVLGTDTHDDLTCLNDLPVMYECMVKHGLQEKLLLPTIRAEEPVAVAR
jgi:hypothetical protein